MMQNGIFTAYFPYGLEETAAKIRSHGFNTVQLDLKDEGGEVVGREAVVQMRTVQPDRRRPVLDRERGGAAVPRGWVLHRAYSAKGRCAVSGAIRMKGRPIT